MALQSKIKQVGYLQTTPEGTTDLSLIGRFFVVVDYFDSATPNTILKTQNFEFPQDTTVAQAQEAIVTFGRTVRDARIRVSELQQYVGATIPIT